MIQQNPLSSSGGRSVEEYHRLLVYTAKIADQLAEKDQLHALEIKNMQSEHDLLVSSLYEHILELEEQRDRLLTKLSDSVSCIAHALLRHLLTALPRPDCICPSCTRDH